MRLSEFTAMARQAAWPEVVKDPKLSNEATQQGDKIRLGPKFYKLPASTRQHVLAHELGHWWRGKFIGLSDIMGWEPGEGFYDLFAAGNSEEGFAEAFAVFLTNPAEVKKRYPDAYDKLKKWVGPKESSLKKWLKDSSI